MRHAPDLPRSARDLVARAVVEALALDDPAAGLAVLNELGPDETATERATLLLALGRVDEAKVLLASRDPEAFERARLAYRLGVLDVYESLLRNALARASGVARGKVLLRLGVWCLDRGHVMEGYRHLEDAAHHGGTIGEPMIEAMAWGEIGMYRTMQGHLEEAEPAIRLSLSTGAPLRSAYLEQVARITWALLLRVQGRDAEADTQRAKLMALTPRRLLEPGAFKFLAVERRLSHDAEAAWDLLAAGLARHQDRPNLPDGAGLQALQASWHGELTDLSDASAFTAALIRAAHGERPDPMLDMHLLEPMVASMGPYQ